MTANQEKSVSDKERERWSHTYPEMKEWVESHKDMVEWMTESTNKNHTPRSDCG